LHTDFDRVERVADQRLHHTSGTTSCRRKDVLVSPMLSNFFPRLAPMSVSLVSRFGIDSLG
jgi:hypothetical protein